MKESLDELIEFADSYIKPDMLDKNRELFAQKRNQLDETEKHIYLKHIAEKQRALIFLAFCAETDPSFTLAQAIEYSDIISKRDIKEEIYDSGLEIHAQFVLQMSALVNKNDKNEYLSHMFEVSIRYDYISTLQELLRSDKDLHFIRSSYEDYKELLENQPDERIRQNVSDYFKSGTIGEDWQNFIVSYRYVPDIYVDYFETKGKEICKENLKSYKKSKLLSNKTTLEELNVFVDNYNWDDGVEIPYFIMKHKSCDLALRKKLFELGAGDCIDEDTYKDTKKIPGNNLSLNWMI